MHIVIHLNFRREYSNYEPLPLSQWDLLNLLIRGSPEFFHCEVPVIIGIDLGEDLLKLRLGCNSQGGPLCTNLNNFCIEL